VGEAGSENYKENQPFSDEGDWCPSEGDEAFCVLKCFGEKLVLKKKNEIALVVTSVKRGSTKLVQALRAYTSLCVCKSLSEGDDSNSLSPLRVFGFVTFLNYFCSNTMFNDERRALLY
jgi:hypothetical protein